MYSIVDIETTGGSASKSRITEIAIFKTDGKQIIDSFSSLINPRRPIPSHISRLTGITDEMVAEAPLFSELAEKIDQFTKDSVFVAHNVNFDYGFMRAEFQRCSISYRRKKLCTVRLSRQIIKGKASYSLGKLCRSLDIPLENRHRAAGDAEATAELFHLLMEKDRHSVIENSLKPQSLEALLPPHISKADFLALPEEQGIYYFKDARKKIVYIGQAKNIKQRVHSHFSGNTNSKSKYYFLQNIYGLDFKLVPNQLLLDLTEAIEIKKHWPRYNRSMKRISLNYGLFSYQDRNGYQRLAIGKCGKYEKPLKSFKNQNEIKDFLRELVIDYELCPRLSGLQPLGSGKCNYVEEIECRGACCGKESNKVYNQRIEQAISERIEKENTYLLSEEDDEGKAIVLVEKGRVKGFGKLASNSPIKSLEQAKKLISSTYDDQDLAIILDRQLRRDSISRKVFH